MRISRYYYCAGAIYFLLPLPTFLFVYNDIRTIITYGCLNKRILLAHIWPFCTLNKLLICQFVLWTLWSVSICLHRNVFFFDNLGLEITTFKTCHLNIKIIIIKLGVRKIQLAHDHAVVFIKAKYTYFWKWLSS